MNPINGRPSIPAYDAGILGTYHTVLDHGFVALTDYMGNEAKIVQAARTSYKPENIPSVSEMDEKAQGLLRYLFSNGHTSPFEQASLTFHAKMPLFVARQWVRHRTAKLNEKSARYGSMDNDRYEIHPDEWRLQDHKNRQGSSQEFLDIESGEMFSDRITEVNRANESIYKDMIEAGVALEIARNHLPLSTYTQWYWTMDVHNLLHLLGLRCDGHAQKEIRAYADVMLGILREGFPETVAAWENFSVRRNAMALSGDEIRILKQVISPFNSKLGTGALTVESICGYEGLTQRETSAFLKKLEMLTSE